MTLLFQFLLVGTACFVLGYLLGEDRVPLSRPPRIEFDERHSDDCPALVRFYRGEQVECTCGVAALEEADRLLREKERPMTKAYTPEEARLVFSDTLEKARLRLVATDKRDIQLNVFLSGAIATSVAPEWVRSLIDGWDGFDEDRVTLAVRGLIDLTPISTEVPE